MTETTYRVSCAYCRQTWPAVGEYLARASAKEHTDQGHLCAYIEQAEGCYCYTLPGTVCDACARIRKTDPQTLAAWRRAWAA